MVEYHYKISPISHTPSIPNPNQITHNTHTVVQMSISLTRAEFGVAGVNGVPMTSIDSCFTVTVTGDSHPVSVNVGVGAGEDSSRLPPTLGSCTYTTRCVCMTCQVGEILNAAFINW